MIKAKISVLLPFFNSGDFLKEAVESILSQDFPDFELLLINNNADVYSIQTAVHFAEADSRVVLLNETEQGIAAALNTGLRYSKGTFIARMDADDICLPGRLRTQFNFLDEHKDTGMVSGRVRPLLNENNEGMLHFIRLNNSLLSQEEMFHHRFIETPLIHPTVMFSKKLIDDFGLYSTDAVPEDYELWLRWFSNDVKICKLPDEVLAWRDHSKRLTRNHQNYSREAFRKVRMHYLADWIKQQSNLPPVHIWGGGKYSRQSADLLKKQGIAISGFIDVNPCRRIEGYEVMHYDKIPEPGTMFIISMISNRDKFLEVREFLNSRNYCEGKDYILAS